MPPVRVETAPVIRVCYRKAAIGDNRDLFEALARKPTDAGGGTKVQQPVQPRHTPLVPRSRARSGLTLLALGAGTVALSGCAAIGDIFKAGVWVGVLMVVGVVALVAGGMAMLRR